MEPEVEMLTEALYHISKAFRSLDLVELRLGYEGTEDIATRIEDLKEKVDQCWEELLYVITDLKGVMEQLRMLEEMREEGA